MFVPNFNHFVTFSDIRNETILNEALTEIEQFRQNLDRVQVNGVKDLVDAVRLRNMVTVSEMVVRSALLRTESRGAHFREDFADQDDQNWRGALQVRRNSEGNEIWEFKEIES